MRIISPPCKRWGWPEMMIQLRLLPSARARRTVRVFTKTLTFVESEERHVTGRFLDNLAANDLAVLVVDEVQQP